MALLAPHVLLPHIQDMEVCGYQEFEDQGSRILPFLDGNGKTAWVP